MKYVCPVCGFEGLDEPAYMGLKPSYEICSCCFFEFGVSEANEVENGWELPFDEAIAIYRKQWLLEGAPVGSIKYFPLNLQENGYVRPNVLKSQLEKIKDEISYIVRT